MPEPKDRHLDEFGYRALRSIRRILHRVSSHSRKMALETGLTVPQLLCMRAVRSLQPDEVTVAAVADTVHLSRSTVSTVIDKLVKAGLVDRQRSTVDRRRVHLTLTMVGEDRLQSAPRPLQDHFLDGLAALAPSAQEELLSALERVVALMDAEDLDAAPMLVGEVDLSAGS